MKDLLNYNETIKKKIIIKRTKLLEDALRQAELRRDQNIDALNTLRGSMSAEEAEEQLKTYKQDLEKLEKTQREMVVDKKRLNSV